MIVKYRHHGILVSVEDTLEGRHREFCLCHRRSYDKEYLKKLRKKAAWIKDVDADEYLNEIRGRK